MESGGEEGDGGGGCGGDSGLPEVILASCPALTGLLF